MPTSIPQVLAPYLQSCLQEGTTTLISSVLNTTANWLVLRTAKSALVGIDDDLGNGQTPSSSTPVVFLSFLRPFEFWLELGKKTGLDLTTYITNKKLGYIDGLTVGLNVPQQTPNTTKPKSHSITDINNAITAAKSVLSPNATSDSKIVLVIDGLDFVLASQPDVGASHLSAFITELREKYSNVMLTTSADSPLLHNIEASATPLELDHSIFVRTIAHQCGWVMQLRPLETGHAKDVSGVVRITRGGADMMEDDSLPNGEWLYQVKGDGNVRVWSRGE